MPNARVIDLSHHNVIPESLKDAAASGVWGVIHKASEGTGFTDDKMQAREFLARDAGMMFGVYHFMRPGDMKAQAKFFYNTASVIMTPDLLIAADYEVSGISIADLKTFMQECERLFARECVLYSGHVLKEQLTAPDSYLNSRKLWLAQYSSTYKLPPGWSKYFLWQHTDQGSVPGIDGAVDLNDYAGSRDQLENDWPHDSQPAPEPGTPTVTVIAPEGVNVIVKKG